MNGRSLATALTSARLRREITMEWATRIAWGLLVLIHVSPALVLAAPGLTARLYGVEASGPLGVLLAHRGALFLAVIVACVAAALDPGSRRVASLVCATSMLGFLYLYVRAGAPAGALRPVAIVDLAGLAPLAWVTMMAWRGPAAG
jgi:hypothetical protein